VLFSSLLIFLLRALLSSLVTVLYLVLVGFPFSHHKIHCRTIFMHGVVSYSRQCFVILFC
ncbi:hypothetical protein L9F63_019071, partial [Diploptera punctata]